MRLFDIDSWLGLGRSGFAGARLVHARDTHGAPGGLINFDECSVQSHVASCNGERCRQIRDEPVHNGIDSAPEDGIDRSAHASIAHESCAPGEDLFVGRLNMSVSADDSGNFSVEKSAHGDFLTCSFTVDIDKDVRGLFTDLCYCNLDDAKRILQTW